MQAQIDFTKSDHNPEGLWQCPSNNYSFSAPIPGGDGVVDFFAMDSNGCQGSVRKKCHAAKMDLHGFVPANPV